MSQIENNTKATKSKISWLSVTSMSLGVLGFSIVVLRLTIYRPWWSEFVGRNIIGLSGIVGLIIGMAALARISRLIAAVTFLVILFTPITSLVVLFSFILFRFSGQKYFQFLLMYSFLASLVCLVGLIVGGAVLQWMSISKGRFKGAAFSLLGIVLTVCLSGLWWAETCGPVSTALGMACIHNLTQLHKAMLTYAGENQGQYPDPNRWCDLLLQKKKVNPKHFFCPEVKWNWRRQVFPLPVPKNAKCYYAMNPYCEPNCPPDMVLLFETDGGWNQFGGTELLTTERHQGRHRCNILFNDGHVEFIKLEQIYQLKWRIEEEKRKQSAVKQPY